MTDFAAELTVPFFESMRMDLSADRARSRELVRHVRLRVGRVVGSDACAPSRHVSSDPTRSSDARLVHDAGALGAAFQKVNFLRDLSDDFETLGRSYFPGVHVDSFTEADKVRLLDDIDADLRVSASAIPALRRRVAPSGRARPWPAFARLAVRLRAAPADRLVRSACGCPTR